MHYRPNWPEEVGVVFKSFLADLKDQIKQMPSEPWLVFSGDLVHSGSDRAQYEGFANEVIKGLDSLGIPKSRRIAVPGNHDVSRTAIKDNIRLFRGSLSALKDEESFLRDLGGLESAFLKGKFDNYIETESQFAAYGCCQERLGGSGWTLGTDIGLYCLNSALCSFGGLEDPSTSEALNDQGTLGLDTRSLYQWETQVEAPFRILVMHHPTDWLSPWAKNEIEVNISKRFNLVLHGHVHHGTSSFVTQGQGGTVFATAPPLFTRKADVLGYSWITFDSKTSEIEVTYRQWSANRTFVLGTVMAGNDDGKRCFRANEKSTRENIDVPSVAVANTEQLLEAEFIEASTCYSSKRQLWVDRDLSQRPETSANTEEEEPVPPESFADRPRSAVVRAPRGFGLTCYAKKTALEHFRNSKGAKALMVCDTGEMEPHRQGVIKYIRSRCSNIGVSETMLDGLILDAWHNCPTHLKIIRIIRDDFPELPLIIFQGFEDFCDISNASVLTHADGFEILYLRSLKRARIRELTHAYLDQAGMKLDPDVVTNRLADDIEALNMHRTPLNCLLLLKLFERTFDESPVNRTQMIGNVLFSLFHDFEDIPKYSTRPDLKDCEFALGYLCEWMIRTNRRAFTKNDFFGKVTEYCSAQFLEIDVDVLFGFLCTENILLRRGHDFTFRHAYWLSYFTAHRMLHSAGFADFIFTDYRYTVFPEVIEFYTGIDRMRTDAVRKLTEDLRNMDAAFLVRTGIHPDLNPFASALWKPDERAITRMHQEVRDSIQESALPNDVKDAVADGTYDRGKPYHQEIAQFIDRSALDQMIQAMKGAARALRNSDHVEPQAKQELLTAVITCWMRMSQILVLISPVLATNRKAQFEGMGFYLDQSFKGESEPNKLWDLVTTAIADNVVSWYQRDLFSKKLAPLFNDYLAKNEGKLGELLLLLVLVRQRPPGWNKTVGAFIENAHKNSFYLNRVYFTLRQEFKLGFAHEQTRQQMRLLAATAVAKHGAKVKRPNQKLLERAKKFFDESFDGGDEANESEMPTDAEET